MRTYRRRNPEPDFTTSLRRELELVAPVVLASKSPLVKQSFMAVVQFAELGPKSDERTIRRVIKAVFDAGWDADSAYRAARSTRTKAVADIVRVLAGVAYRSSVEESWGRKYYPHYDFLKVERNLEIAMGGDPSIRERAAYEAALLIQDEDLPSGD